MSIGGDDRPVALFAATGSYRAPLISHHSSGNYAAIDIN
jgi:hypothetical protein